MNTQIQFSTGTAGEYLKSADHDQSYRLSKLFWLVGWLIGWLIGWFIHVMTDSL